jgi:hypothetical protein
MADRPIIFSAPMIRALLDGRKTQTRRVLKPQPEYCVVDGSALPVGLEHVEGRPFPQVTVGRVITRQEVRFASGDCLWAREAHAISANPARPVWYRAGHEEARASGPRVDLKWRPSIHMPRWASRLTLIVEGVKVEPLQDISEADAIAEGCFKGKATGRIYESMASTRLGGGEWACARDWYADLWERLHGADAWNANPFVAAITFRTIRANIDTLDANGCPLVREGVTP